MIQGLLADPMFQMGMGLLSAKNTQDPWGSAMRTYLTMQDMQSRRDYRQFQMDEKRREMEREEAKRQAFSQFPSLYQEQGPEAALMAIAPYSQGAISGLLSMNEPVDPVVVDKRLVNPRTGEVVYETPRQPDYKVVGGQLFNTGTGQWLAPPGGGGPTNYWTPETIAKEYNLSDFTPESVEAAMGSRNPSLLQPKGPAAGDLSTWHDKAQKQVTALRNVAQAGRQIQTLLGNPGPFSDVATVYSLVKLLDPESVVREGEIALTQSATSIWDRLRGMLSKAHKGGFISDDLRADINQTVGRLMSEYEKSYQEVSGYWSDFAQRRGMGPAKDLIGPELRFPTISPTGGILAPEPDSMGGADIDAELENARARLRALEQDMGGAP